MPAIHVRDIPEEVIEALKRRAARHRRSLQKELVHILESLARDEPEGIKLPPLELKFSKAERSESGL